MTNHDELCEKDGEKFKQNWVDVSEQSRRLVEKNEEIKELRTRVAELEKRLTKECQISSKVGEIWENENIELKKRVAELTNHEEQTHKDLGEILGTDDSMKNCALRLQTRVAELEKEKEGLKKEIVDYIEASGKLHRREIQDMKDFKRQFTDVVIESLDKENKELQNRLSTLNAEIEGNGGYKDMLKGFQFKIESLESRLSTLLKASEGMEKALETTHDMLLYSRDYFKKRMGNHPENELGKSLVGIETAHQALADFRAVKEGL